MKGYLWSFLILPLIISCGAKVDDLDFDLNPTSEKEVEEIPKITTVGSLDVTFGGGDGYVVTSGSGAGDDDMKASAIDSNGKLVVVGEMDEGAPNNVDIAIWRFNTDGSLDTSFGGTGQVTFHSSGTYSDYANAVTIDSNGKILVTGSVEVSSNSDMVVLRFNSDGSLDTTFGGGDGVFTHDGAAGAPGEFDSGSGIAVDSNQKIVVAGHSDSDPTAGLVFKATAWRLNSDGTLDTSFDGIGYSVFGGDNSLTNSLALDTSNNIFLGGYRGVMQDDIRLWKLNSNGSPDTSFGTSGVAIYDGHGFMVAEASYDITLDSDGNILVAGKGNGDLALLRYTSAGVLDITFGTGGVVTHDNAAGGNGGDQGNAVIVDHEGNILVAGQSGNGTNGDLAVWKFLPDGSLDTDFAGVGYMTIDGTGGPSVHDDALGINLDQSGHIIVTGLTYNGSDNDAVIWKIK